MATTAAGPRPYTGKAHELVPEFSNRSSEYKEYRKRFMLYERKMALASRSKETAFNLMSVLHGRAWSAVEDLNITDLEAEDGWKKILERLDAVFKYDALTELPYDFETFFFHTYRKKNQTVQEYCADFERQLRKLDQHGVALPDKVIGWFFLRRAGLRREQRQMVMSTLSTEKLALDSVRKALNFVIGQDAVPEGMMQGTEKRWGKGQKDSIFYEEDEYEDEAYFHNEQESWEPEDSPTYYDDVDAAYYEEGGEESVFEAEEAVAEYDDVLAAYTDARQKLNQLRVSRGFFPVVAMMPEAKDSYTRKGGGKGKKGKGKFGKGKSSYGKQGPRPPNPIARGKAALGHSSAKCLRCGGFGHMSKSCPHANKRKAESQEGMDTEINMVADADAPNPAVEEICLHDDDGTESEPDDTAIWDSGAASILVSRYHLRKYLKILMMKGFNIHTIKAWRCTKGFKFGNGQRDNTSLCVLLPTFFKGKRRDILVYVIGGKVQFLLGRPLLENLGIIVDHQKKMMQWPGEDWLPIPLGPKGEYIMHLSEHMHLTDRNDVTQTLVPEDFYTHVRFEDEVDVMTLVNNRDLEVNFQGGDDPIESEATVHLELKDETPPMVKFVDEKQLYGHGDTTEAVTIAAERTEDAGVQRLKILDEGDKETVNEETAEPPREGKSPTRAPRSDERGWKQLTPQKLRKLTYGTVNHVKNVERMMRNVPNEHAERKIKIWEVFAGKGRVTKILQEKYPMVEAERFSLLDGWDFQEAEHRKKFLRKLREDEPDSVLLSPPCRLWSQLQELAASRSEEARDGLRLRREEDHDTILTFIAVVYEEQRRNGRDATCEHPWTSKAWKTKAFSKMQGYDSYVDQCQYKLKLPDDQGVVRPVRKPTCFRTTGPVIYDLLWAPCDEGHTHTPLEGNIPGVGSRSKLAEDYTQQLAAKLAEAMVAQYNAWTEAYAVEDVESHNREAEAEVSIPEHVAKNRTLKQKVGRRAVEYVQRLHKNMGHISSEVLVRMLTEVQATDNVLQAAREYVCPTCYARQQPPQVPPSSAVKTTEFNQRIQVDTHWILCEQSAVREREANPGTPAGKRRERGELTGRQCVMTIVDHATRYCAIRILKSESAEEFTKGLERCWFKHFGVPKYLRMDEAKGWSSKHVREWCASRSISIEVAPAEQHSWLGVVERKHQVVRRALELYQDDLGRHDLAALKEAAIYVPHTINQMSMVRGFTPQQWVLGKTMTNVHGLTSEIFNPGQEPLDDSGAFAQVQQRRVRAQMAWIKADTDAKLRRAFNQKFVEVKEQVVVGQRCWYWRMAGSGILLKAKWRGPARVVAIEEHDSARVIWVCHGTSLVRCSDRQVRPLVEETGTIVEVDHKAALKDLEDLKARSTTQYKDELQADGGPDFEMNDEDDHPGDPDSDRDYVPTTDEDEDGPDGAHGLRTSELPGVISMMIPRPLDRSDRERTPRGSEGGRSAETEVPETPLIDPETPRDEDMDPFDDLVRTTRGHSPKRKSEETAGKLARRRKDRASSSTTTTRPPVIVEEEIPQDTEPSSAPQQLPHNVHVPGSSEEDDELAVDVLIHDVIGQLPEGWRCVEGDIEMEDVYYMAVRKGEVNQKKLNLDEREQFVEAKRSELEQYFNNDVWEFSSTLDGQKAEAAGRVITARWVLTWKKIDTEDETPTRWKAKARLVLRGFEDPDLLSLQKAAPTASRLARMMLLSVAQWSSWSVMCGDVKTAFLSGKEFSRELVVRLPADCSPLLGAGPGPCYMKMRKSAYGLADAPLLWYQEADRRLRSGGWEKHPIDQCCYLLSEKEGKATEKRKLIALIILHVDDLLITGEKSNRLFQQAMTELKKKFNFGKWDELTKKTPVKYCGGTIIQTDEAIELSYEEYMSKVCPMTIQKTRKPTDAITAGEMSKARGLIGALQWPATQGMPALSASVSIQAGELSGGNVEALQGLNKTLRFGKSNSQVRLRFVAKDVMQKGLNGLTIVMFADAAFDVRRDHSSQGGYILLVGSDKVLTGEKCPMSTVSWRSFRLPRVCRSSLAAECQALATALEELMMVKAFLSKLQQPEKQLKDIKDNLKSECAVVTDCKALYDCVKRETIQQATDKRVAIEALVIKDLLKDMSCEFRWISSERQLADGLTKIGARQSFVERYKGSHVQLVADETYTASKKKTKEERQRTIQETRGTRSTAAQALIAYAMSEAIQKAEAHELPEGEELSEKDWTIITAVMVVVVTMVIFAVRRMWRFATDFYMSLKEDAEKDAEIDDLKSQVEKLKKELKELGKEAEELSYTDGEKTMRIEELEKSYAELDSICTHQLSVARDRTTATGRASSRCSSR